MRLQRHQPFDDGQPFTRADARAAGLPLGELLGRGYRRIFHDVHLRAGARLDVSVRARAACGLNGEGTYASHATAVEIWGGVVPERGPVHVSVPDGKPRSERQGIRAHRSLAKPDVRTRLGVRVSAPAQALIEMARDGVDLVDLVVAADSLVRAGALDLDALRTAAATWTGRGSRVARRAASLARKGVDSAMETRLRLLIVLAGLPEPEVNHLVRDEIGTTVLRFDLCYPALNLLIEYDGRQHAESEAQWKRDVRRRELLDRLGLRLLVVLSEGIYERPAETLDRVATTLRERGVVCGGRTSPSGSVTSRVADQAVAASGTFARHGLKTRPQPYVPAPEGCRGLKTRPRTQCAGTEGCRGLKTRPRTRPQVLNVGRGLKTRGSGQRAYGGQRPEPEHAFL